LDTVVVEAVIIHLEAWLVDLQVVALLITTRAHPQPLVAEAMFLVEQTETQERIFRVAVVAALEVLVVLVEELLRVTVELEKLAA
jgi:hypothetical protein